MGMNDTTQAGAGILLCVAGYATHEVLNQAGALADYDAYGDDKALVEAVGVRR